MSLITLIMAALQGPDLSLHTGPLPWLTGGVKLNKAIVNVIGNACA